ncbi:MAG: hypothetical protein VX871_12565 [Pseudomonadota bacterium]|nr:hypothetical protein [Pseudomonadota bacterium]
MTAGQTIRAEYAILAGFILLLIGLLFVPWSEFAAYHGAAQNKKFDVIGLRSGPQKPVRRISVWRAQLDYSPAKGVLEVDLASKYDEPLDGVLLEADFTSLDGARGGGMLLERHADGTFRSGRLDLGSGKWLVGLTASRRSVLMFRLEQPLSVD